MLDNQILLIIFNGLVSFQGEYIHTILHILLIYLSFAYKLAIIALLQAPIPSSVIARDYYIFFKYRLSTKQRLIF